MYKYKNITDMDHDVVGVGLVRAGETIDTETRIYNKNFELLEGDPEADHERAQAGNIPVEAPSVEQQVTLDPPVLPQEDINIGGIQ